jgi:hypothetical protein
LRYSEFDAVIQLSPDDLFVGESRGYCTEHVVLTGPGVPLIEEIYDPLCDLFRCACSHREDLVYACEFARLRL